MKKQVFKRWNPHADSTTGDLYQFICLSVKRFVGMFLIPLCSLCGLCEVKKQPAFTRNERISLMLRFAKVFVILLIGTLLLTGCERAIHKQMIASMTPMEMSTAEDPEIFTIALVEAASVRI